MSEGQQVKNGKAFEYALALSYYEHLSQLGLAVCMEENDAFHTNKSFYEEQPAEEQIRFREAASKTIETMIKLEPGLTAQRNEKDVLRVLMINDIDGEGGDVRDVVFKRTSPVWEIGFSAKNNNDAVKHSRLSSILDFGKSWVDFSCSATYWAEIKEVFDYIGVAMQSSKTWNDIGDDKIDKVYKPLLKAFRKELLRIDKENAEIPQKLIKYLIGKYPFYKIIKDDTHNMVIVKAFNLNGELNKNVNGKATKYKTPKLFLPTRIVEFEFKPDSDNTLCMILDGGWEISFRIHNASSKLEKSLKFDIKLLGNPPILFTQYLFQN